MKNCFITESKVHLNKEVDVKQPAYTLFFFIRMLFSQARLNILIFPQILGFKYSCIILNNS